MSAAQCKLLRCFAYSVELLAVFVVQQTPGLLPEVYGARPTLVVPLALSIAMFEQEGVSLGFGLAGGLLIDFGLGHALGFHALLLGTACYFLSLLAANYFKNNLLTALLTSLAATPVLFALQWVFYYLLFGYGHAGLALVREYLPRAAYTFAFTPLFYYFNRAFAVLIRPEEDGST